jgi:hypothetical protein
MAEAHTRKILKLLSRLLALAGQVECPYQSEKLLPRMHIAFSRSEKKKKKKLLFKCTLRGGGERR